eukprot:scaffold241189_cov15-Tisochrysis_lutea.AAC.1
MSSRKYLSYHLCARKYWNHALTLEARCFSNVFPILAPNDPMFIPQFPTFKPASLLLTRRLYNAHASKHGACFRFMRVCAAAPHINLTDLARAAVSAPDSWLAFNPFLSAGSCARLREACLIWMQLCVLEDRLHRISRL